MTHNETRNLQTVIMNVNLLQGKKSSNYSYMKCKILFLALSSLNLVTFCTHYMSFKSMTNLEPVIKSSFWAIFIDLDARNLF